MALKIKEPGCTIASDWTTVFCQTSSNLKELT